MEQPSSSLTPFAWIQKRDGRLVPFEADRISRALFAASESLGRPDAFLARELTDGILHFLPTEVGSATPTTGQIAEVVIKVVRELGQPGLARAYADGQGQKAREKYTGQSAERRQRLEPPTLATGQESVGNVSEWVTAALPPGAIAWRAASATLQAYSLREVYTRDLVAAQSDGLLTLTGLETPLELTGHVLALSMERRCPLALAVMEAVEEARATAGRFVTLDGPEYVLALHGTGAESASEFIRALELALRAVGLGAVLSVNAETPPTWAEGLAEGPLFSTHRPSAQPEELTEITLALAEQTLRTIAAAGSMRVHVHLGARDFLAGAAPWLLRLARCWLDGLPLDFVFDRPRRPVTLAEGIDRRHPAVLTAVRLNLPRLLDQLGAERTVPRFLQKLSSLARLGLSAATQKRDFLRRHAAARPGLTRGFLLDRARLVAVPGGLETVVRALTGHGICSGGRALDAARQIVARLAEVLHQDGRACHLDTCVDGELAPGAGVMEAMGVTAWDETATPASQLQASAPLHVAAGGGTAHLLFAEGQGMAAEEAVGLLREAWQRTEIVRLRCTRVSRPPRQLAASWAGSMG
jgi:hypothetical protein